MLNMQAAADYVGISRSRFYRHYKADWHIAHYRVGNRVNFRQRDLDAYLERQREVALKAQTGGAQRQPPARFPRRAGGCRTVRQPARGLSRPVPARQRSGWT
jgi:excisionase family DNA binding protein